ncbi:ERMES complex subunit [Taxawa tesnikishii (nom. ined.)]|nr:ERMES complex subunit [Dothideales sp. JES 119]
MAFNFNWSPLIADTSKAREMLTTALNKSPKPPIIVDDIIVNELNLGSRPPELEILEIGDLAEDRFRGIFKMSYRGDAYLTLKTKVEANPLKTNLSTKPSFASPEPLAASSGLTIPLQITLSDIRLSGFVILVFSRQKGITLVFRNDPLESLKVSSTFDSIPFVRNYLQKEIEKQLRVLFMDDLPAIIHRLSLRAFVPEYQRAAEEEKKAAEETQAPNPVDAWGNPLDEESSFSLDAPTETYASFSQKNLLRLAALTESQRTLSLFTPSIRDTVFRAWAGATDRDSTGQTTPHTRPHSLARLQSSIGSSWSSNASETSETPSHASRPSVASYTSSSTVYTMSTNRSRAHANRKRKNRVVNLRKTTEKDEHDDASVSSEFAESTSTPSIKITEAPTTPVSEEPEGDVSTPPRTGKVRFQRRQEDIPILAEPKARSRPSTPRQQASTKPAENPDDQTPRPARSDTKRQPLRPKPTHMQSFPLEKRPVLSRSSSTNRLQSQGSSGGILEQAWMMKMAAEIARKVHEEKVAGQTGGFWDRTEGEDAPPPAYAA